MSIVLNAIRRWEEKGLVEGALAERLREEVADAAAADTRSLFRYVIAGTGAVIVLIAAGVFLDWAWPLMTEGLRSALLFAVGLGVFGGGTRLEGKGRWIPASYLMQAAGLGVMVIALVYSENAWPDLSPGGIASGIVALVLPIVLGLRSVRANRVMPAVHLAVGLILLSVFLDRATPLDQDGVLWVLDGVLLLVTAGLIRMLSGDPDGTRNPWALNAFAAALYAGFVLVFFTGSITLSMGDDTLYPLDVWLFLIMVLTVYGIHWAPTGLRRGWFGVQLAVCQLVWIPLGFGSTVGITDAPPEAALMAVGGSGVLGFLYARKNRVREILATSAVSFICAAWYWGVERAGALGAVAALVATAGLLFWVSGRDDLDGTDEKV